MRFSPDHCSFFVDFGPGAFAGKVGGTNPVLDELAEVEVEFIAQFAHFELALQLVSGRAFLYPFFFIVLDLKFEALNFRAVTVWSVPCNHNVSILSDH